MMTPEQKELLLLLADVVGQLIPHQLEDTATGDKGREVKRQIDELVEQITTPPPAPEVRSARNWQARVHTACGAACQYGIVDQNGTWHTLPDGSVYLTHSLEVAKRKAKRLNELRDEQ